MKTQDFNINVFALKIGKHEFEYEIDGEFLTVFDPELSEKATTKTILELRKSETMIEAHFNITGEIELTCDRSLEKYMDEVNTHHRMFFKFGEEAEELSDEIEIIPYHQHHLDISHLIYEFIAISLPMKKVHPQFRDEELEEELEALIYSSDFSEEETEEPSTEDEKQDNRIDPRWEALKNISKN